MAITEVGVGGTGGYRARAADVLGSAVLRPLAIGGVVGGLQLLAIVGGAPVLMAPFAASAMLAIAAPALPASRPWAIVGGNVLAAGLGVAASLLLGSGPLAMVIAVILSAALMQLTRTTHAPAAATALVAVSAGSDWWFVLSPVLVGAVAIVAMAGLYHRLSRDRA